MDIGRRIGRYFPSRRPAGSGEGGEGSGDAGSYMDDTHGAGTALMVAGEGPEPMTGPGDNERTGEGVMMDEERLQILRMFEERKITAEEAAKLLEALDAPSARSAGPQPGTRARWLRVRVTDKASGRPKVNVNIPVSAVLALGKLGNRFGFSFLEKEGLDLEDVVEAIKNGAEGKIVDVDDENSRDRVEVIVE